MHLTGRIAPVRKFEALENAVQDGVLEFLLITQRQKKRFG
jgi:hypothetical protein